MRSAFLLGLFALVLGPQSHVAFGQNPPKPRLGVSLEVDGISIESVSKDSIGHQAGLMPGDYLVGWGAKKIASIDDVLDARDRAKPGSQTQFVVLRGGKDLSLAFKIPDSLPDSGLVLGVTVGLGVHVSKVYPDSPAAKAGIQIGDILNGFDDEPIESFNDLREALAAVRPGSRHRLALRRGPDEKRVSVHFAEPKTAEVKQPKTPKSVTPPPSAPWLDGASKKGMDFVDGLMELDELQSDLEKIRAKLRALEDPKLSSAISDLEKAVGRLSKVADSVKGMKSGVKQFRGLLGRRELPMTQGTRFEDLQKRIQELIQDGVMDSKELNDIIRREFPGMQVQIDFGGSGGVDEFDDFEDIEEVEEEEPVKKGLKPLRKKAASRPSTRPSRSTRPGGGR